MHPTMETQDVSMLYFNVVEDEKLSTEIQKYYSKPTASNKDSSRCTATMQI